MLRFLLAALLFVSAHGTLEQDEYPAGSIFTHMTNDPPHVMATIYDFMNQPCPDCFSAYNAKFFPSGPAKTAADFNPLFNNFMCKQGPFLPLTGLLMGQLDSGDMPVCNASRAQELIDLPCSEFVSGGKANGGCDDRSLATLRGADTGAAWCSHFNKWYRNTPALNAEVPEFELPGFVQATDPTLAAKGWWETDYLASSFSPIDCTQTGITVANPQACGRSPPDTCDTKDVAPNPSGASSTGLLSCTGFATQDPYDDSELDPEYRAIKFANNDAIRANGHNSMFATKMRAQLMYLGSSAFDSISFDGDDDFWVFVNGYLVIDLGGVHRSIEGVATWTLDGAEAQRIGMYGSRKGTIFIMNAFHAERCTPSASFKLSTTFDSGVTPIMKRDPHLRGFHGDVSDFKGVNNTVYALHSARHLQVNARFLYDTFYMGSLCPTCGHKTVHGSKMAVAYVSALSADGTMVRVSYDASKPSRALLEAAPTGHRALEAELSVSQSMPDTDERLVGDVAVLLTRKHQREAEVTVSTREYIISATSRFYPWAAQNNNKKMLDISILPRVDTRKLPVASHGLIGQTDDRDFVAVDGAKDDYTAGTEITTKAMGEGAIEGEPVHYEITPADPFSVEFKYSRFYKEAAEPRDVSKLTGEKRASTKKPKDQMAGAGVDTLPAEVMAAAGGEVMAAAVAMERS